MSSADSEQTSSTASSLSTPLVLKVAHAGDLRRVSVASTLPFAAVAQLVRARCRHVRRPPPPRTAQCTAAHTARRVTDAHWTLTYVDADGDRITVASEPEWRLFVAEALRERAGEPLRVALCERPHTACSARPADAHWPAATAHRGCGGVGRKRMARCVEPQADGVRGWRVRNVSGRAWPARVDLVHVGGAALGVEQPRAVAGRAAPNGGECVVSLGALALPVRAGEHHGYFRLRDPATGVRFGQRLRVRVHVDAAPAAPAAPAVAGDDGADDETRQAARAHVASIGFDADRAEAALVAHGWNVEAAVAALLDD